MRDPGHARLTRPGAPPCGVRRRSRWSLLVLFVCLVGVACGRGSGASPFETRVVGVLDGDTVTVLRGREQVRVRLHGIDCPERGQPFGARAKRFTSDLAFGRTVTVRPRSKDRYGRLVAEVVLPDGRSLNRELVAAGLAWHYTRYSKDEALAHAERDARAARLGLWAEDRAVAPWELRARERRDGR